MEAASAAARLKRMKWIRNGPKEEGKQREGGGGGGGAAGRATPHGYIRITPEDVSYKPISDDERIPLAGIFMIVWSVFWVALTARTLIKTIPRTKSAQG